MTEVEERMRDMLKELRAFIRENFAMGVLGSRTNGGVMVDRIDEVLADATPTPDLPSEARADGVKVKAWPVDTDDQVEALALECEWDNRSYMTAADYAIWCMRMRKFARLAALESALTVPSSTAQTGDA